MNRTKIVINKILDDVKQKDQKYILKNRLDFTNVSLEKWKKNAIFAKNILDENKIEYCLFKGYDIPYAIMDDVDILVEDNVILKNLYLKLKKNGFIFKHIPFNDELKVSAINIKSNFEIDFYPDAKWGELRYEQKGQISKNKKIGFKQGLEFFIPNPEYEIYIVATHSYYHGRINLLEILNTIKIILDEKPSIQKIINISKKFHMQNAVLALLSVTKKVMEDYNINEIKNEDIEELKEIANHRFKSLSKKNFSIDDLPLKFSVSDLLFASLSKFFANNLDGQAKKTDELAVFVKHNRFSNFVYSKLSKKYNQFSEI